MPSSVIYWCCTACHKTGSGVDSIEALEVEHALVDRCNGRLVETVAPLRAVAVCQQCGKQLEGDVRKSTLTKDWFITFSCGCPLTVVPGLPFTVASIPLRAITIVSSEAVNQYPDRVLYFEPVFGLKRQPELCKPKMVHAQGGWQVR